MKKLVAGQEDPVSFTVIISSFICFYEVVIWVSLKTTMKNHDINKIELKITLNGI